MTIPVRLEIQAEARPTQNPALSQGLSPCTMPCNPDTGTQLSAAELAFRIFAAFRAHSHINNVLTHISGANWTQVEHALEAILDQATTGDRLSPLAQNIVDLVCAERGITGRILKPYFQAALYRLLESSRAERLIRHIEMLFFEIELKAEHPAFAPSAPSTETGHE
ncbi:hypothetical protein [Bradyrhizobium monzae]|uniref:hypothetical protein n=1 Tax=Bradyrhizobium sp. Oc8 TaxID=2876780 RepID=UPI001F1C9E5E|nr:hypothetical protein [Bradyrhizobium sp. Oc8]